MLVVISWGAHRYNYINYQIRRQIFPWILSIEGCYRFFSATDQSFYMLVWRSMKWTCCRNLPIKYLMSSNFLQAGTQSPIWLELDELDFRLHNVRPLEFSTIHYGNPLQFLMGHLKLSKDHIFFVGKKGLSMGSCETCFTFLSVTIDSHLLLCSLGFWCFSYVS